ncbi:unnamed protein product [Didymodactylos carnosus]|uniref:NAD(P)(+)--arginine ADP-ribosyltransferase n=1 Tax=Didymodactylos carnosus TaxID=1234261 RepID=A0A813YF45_9BILA|nr:unnamed protein product [Didymodactylos carnosus]CAF1105161.1 unnamed protein product [Didymodactylos carnosus]CAF3669138.1 unnamed protein product [Didymodactylos carnosus]CAF3868377.1 unnamed protein product [Didymodactylos carnosus]
MDSQAVKLTGQTRAQWYWKSNSDPLSNQKEEWTNYSVIESEIIEEAFKGKDKTKLAELDNYWISVNDGIQISKSHENKQRPIKRVLTRRNQCLREERFFLPQPLNKPFNDDLGTGAVTFLSQWKKDEKLSDPEIVEKAANGIIIEGNQLGQHCESQWIARQLTAVKNKDRKEIYKSCIKLYTKECFLYKLINKTMRENDKTKVDTLGPFCYILFRSWYTDDKGCPTGIYRGAEMDSNTINLYAEAIGQRRCWNGFSSTSKSHEKAANFGNTLFIIEAKEYSGIDISSCSDFPEEDEVLLPPATAFTITKVEYDQKTHKTNIYLTLQYTGGTGGGSIASIPTALWSSMILVVFVCCI